MSWAATAIRRPVTVLSLFILTLSLGVLALIKMPVDLFPRVSFPVVTIITLLPGGSPEDLESLVSIPMERELSSQAGLRSLRSINKSNVSVVVAEFNFGASIEDAEQQLRHRIDKVSADLPETAERPVIRRVDPGEQPLVILAFKASQVNALALRDLIDEEILPRLERVENVGLVEVIGAPKREVRVELDRQLLKDHDLSVLAVSQKIASAGRNVPIGDLGAGETESSYRSVGEFRSLADVSKTPVMFWGNDTPIRIDQLGTVVNGLAPEDAWARYNGERVSLIQIYRRSGANSVKVADDVLASVDTANAKLKAGGSQLIVVRDGAKPIRDNLFDVGESIVIGVILTVLVVLFFLKSFRSTFITGMALPNSLFGAFILMAVAGYSVNIMTLLALSLAVGLLIDDAIVVRENIFKHLEKGASPRDAALHGTNEVKTAVIATTFAVLAVFVPIAFIDGVVGQFFREFGLTVCFALIISLVDALTMAPMMSAYMNARVHRRDEKVKNSRLAWASALFRGPLTMVERALTLLESAYRATLARAMRYPLSVVAVSMLVFLASLFLLSGIPKTFMPAQDNGEFLVSIEAPVGSTLAHTQSAVERAERVLATVPDISKVSVRIGNAQFESHRAEFYVQLVDFKKRSRTTREVQRDVRTKLQSLADLAPKVKDFDVVGVGYRPFTMNIGGKNMDEIRQVAAKIESDLRGSANLVDIESNLKQGKPEVRFEWDTDSLLRFGVSSMAAGQELRAQVEGVQAGVFKEGSREYDLRLRLAEADRDLKQNFAQAWVPNMNNSLVRLSSLASLREVQGAASITRQDRNPYIEISAEVAAGGGGLGAAIDETRALFAKHTGRASELTLRFVGYSEKFGELVKSMLLAGLLGTFFIYLVLACLYESFVTPLLILTVVPLALCGAFTALYVFGASLDIFSMIGCVMLLGVAAKNSILLVDAARQRMANGLPTGEAIFQAGTTRLRPILMTSVALVAGMLPVAIGLNEASAQRSAMGIAVIGGIVSSTVMSLYVVPALLFFYHRKFRREALPRALSTWGLAPVRVRLAKLRERVLREQDPRV